MKQFLKIVSDASVDYVRMSDIQSITFQHKERQVRINMGPIQMITCLGRSEEHWAELCADLQSQLDTLTLQVMQAQGAAAIGAKVLKMQEEA